MNNRKMLAWGVIVTAIILYTGYEAVRPKNKSEPEILHIYYLDELRLWTNTTWVFNSSDGSEALQWALDNLNGTDAVIVRGGVLGFPDDDLYKVGIQK